MEKKFRTALTGLFLIAALASCAFGAWRGESDTVLRKAANICMECIGLG